MDLDPVTVLEVGGYVAAPYAGKLFSDLGATVLKLEPPEGDPGRRVAPFGDGPPGESSGFFGYLNTGKRSATLARDPDLAPAVVHDLIEAHGVDLVVADVRELEAYGIGSRELADAVDGTSVVSVSGFGDTGPWSEHAAPDIVAMAESGHMNKMGYPDRPPTRPRIKAADYWAGQFAAASGLAALLHRDRNGGPGQHVDVSSREAGLSSMERFVSGYSWGGETTERTGYGYADQGPNMGFPTIYETADGHVSAAPFGDERWEAFCLDLADRPELLEDERFADRESRRANMDQLRDVVEEYTRERGKHELLAEFQAHGIPSAVTSTPADVVEFDHLRERGFWEDLELPSGETATMPGAPFRADGERFEMDRAPRLGEHTDSILGPTGYDPERLRSTADAVPAVDRDRRPSSGGSSDDPGDDLPLDGVKVLDFTWVYAGPTVTKYLAALGADVAKVESKRKPDRVRLGSGYGAFEAGPDNLDVSAYFNEQNQGKRDLRLDLTSERGRELALALAAEADVWVEAYAPTFMERVDLEYERVAEVNPEIVYLSMPGWGRSGPASAYRSYGLNLQSMAGLDDLSGFPGDPPTAAGFSWPDPTAGHVGLVAVLAALSHRERTGEGTSLELAQLEATLTYLHKPIATYTMEDRLPERVGNRDEDGRLVQGVYPCAGEDRWAVVAVETDAQWEQLCGVMGRPELADDERFASQYARLEHHDAVDEEIASWTRERTGEEVRDRLRDHGVPAGLVADERDLVEYDPQLRARDYFAVHDHPEVGEQTYQGVPFRMSACDVSFASRAPLFGEHTEEVLSEWLDMVPEDIEAAREVDALF